MSKVEKYTKKTTLELKIRNNIFYKFYLIFGIVYEPNLRYDRQSCQINSCKIRFEP